MTKIKLNLTSGTSQEKEVVTAFNFEGVKYIIFDGESTGSMGLPIILVSKENYGKVSGITDAEEWKNTKECLKKIIAGETVEYAYVEPELKGDDIYYRQLTLPIASFDILKSSYKAPDKPIANENVVIDNTPVYDPITPEDVVGGEVKSAEPVMPSVFNMEPQVNVSTPVVDHTPVSEQNVPGLNNNSVSTNNVGENGLVNNQETDYQSLKNEFLNEASILFDKYFEKFNH